MIIIVGLLFFMMFNSFLAGIHFSQKNFWFWFVSTLVAFATYFVFFYKIVLGK